MMNQTILTLTASASWKLRTPLAAWPAISPSCLLTTLTTPYRCGKCCLSLGKCLGNEMLSTSESRCHMQGNTGSKARQNPASECFAEFEYCIQQRRRVYWSRTWLPNEKKNELEGSLKGIIMSPVVLTLLLLLWNACNMVEAQHELKTFYFNLNGILKNVFEDTNPCHRKFFTRRFIFHIRENALI